jgi:hypothetical protein
MEIPMMNQERDPMLRVEDSQLGMAERRRFRLSGTGSQQALWSIVVIFFIVVALFTVFYEVADGNRSNEPAVIATPAPATRVPAPAPETTTGQGVPRPNN